MECKHSNGGILPSDDDVKDGLLKLILFTNLDKLYNDKKETKFKPVIRLTSNKMIGYIHENSTEDDCRYGNRLLGDVGLPGCWGIAESTAVGGTQTLRKR